jgi:hypothetical protein
MSLLEQKWLKERMDIASLDPSPCAQGELRRGLFDLEVRKI